MALTTVNTDVNTADAEEDSDFEIVLSKEDDEDSEDDIVVDDLNEDEEEEEENEDEDWDTEEDSDEEFEDDEDEEEDDSDEELEKTEKKSKRENDRVRTLVEQRKATEAALEKERKEKLALRTQMIELQKATQKTNTNLLTNHIKSLKGQMVKAQEDGEVEQLIDLQEQLNKTQMDLNQLENWKPEEITEAEKRAATHKVEPTPMAAQDWFEDNPWFQNPQTKQDRKRQREAIAYADILVDEGYSLESEALYEMVNERLEKLGLANTDENDVESKKSSKKSSKGRKTSKKRISQTVQGASRSPNSRKNKSSRKKIILSPEQQRIAALCGMSNQEYAQELIKIEQSKKSGQRMTPI